MQKDDLMVRLDMLDDAQGKLGEAIELIKFAIHGTHIEPNVTAYLVDHLNIMASSGHGFISGDLNIDKVKDMLREKEDEEG